MCGCGAGGGGWKGRWGEASLPRRLGTAARNPNLRLVHKLSPVSPALPIGSRSPRTRLHPRRSAPPTAPPSPHSPPADAPVPTAPCLPPARGRDAGSPHLSRSSLSRFLLFGFVSGPVSQPGRHKRASDLGGERPVSSKKNQATTTRARRWVLSASREIKNSWYSSKSEAAFLP